MQAEVSKIIKSHSVAKRLTDIGVEPIGSNAEQLAAHQRVEIAKWVKVVVDSARTASVAAVNLSWQPLHFIPSRPPDN